MHKTQSHAPFIIYSQEDTHTLCYDTPPYGDVVAQPEGGSRAA